MILSDCLQRFNSLAIRTWPSLSPMCLRWFTENKMERQMDKGTRSIGDPVRALVTRLGASPQKHETSSLQRALDERMTLPEALEAAGAIVDCYPNGGRDAGRGYLGALATMLADYPKQVARRCADRVNGVVRECRFLPTPADIVAWCERETEALRGWRAREMRVVGQLKDRAAFEQEQAAERRTHLSVAELKAKYGDWRRGWSLEEDRQEQRRLAREMLIAEIGREAFGALPDSFPQREAAE